MQTFYKYYIYPGWIKQTKQFFYKFKPDKDFVAAVNARKHKSSFIEFCRKKNCYFQYLVVRQFACEGKRKAL